MRMTLLIFSRKEMLQLCSLDTELAKWWVIAARRSEFSCFVYEFLFKKNACLKDNSTLFIVTFPNFFCRRQGIAKTLGCCHWNKWKCHIHPFNISNLLIFSFTLSSFLCPLAVTQYERSKDKCSHCCFKKKLWVWLAYWLKKNTIHLQANRESFWDCEW